MQAPNPRLSPADQVEAEAAIHHAVIATKHKAAKRTLPWDLKLDLVSQDADNPARKKQRLEEPLPETTDEAARKTASPDTTVALSPPPPPDASADYYADSDLLTSGEASPVAESTLEEDFPPQQQPTSQKSGDPPGEQPQPGQQQQYSVQPQQQQQQMEMPYSMPPQGNNYGGQMPMHPLQQRRPTGPHPGYHPGHYMPPQQMPGPGMYQRQMDPGMPNMPPNMILGPSRMPYYPGQGGLMPYRAATTMLVLDQRLHSSIDPTSVRNGRRDQVEGCRTNARCQELGGNCSSCTGSNEKSVFR
jgi:hypothetical protein